jgi:hypothetical protein
MPASMVGGAGSGPAVHDFSTACGNALFWGRRAPAAFVVMIG